MKNTFFKQNGFMRKVALFYIFANLLNVQLNGRQLDSLICFCIQFAADVICHVASAKLCLELVRK